MQVERQDEEEVQRDKLSPVNFRHMSIPRLAASSDQSCTTDSLHFFKSLSPVLALVDTGFYTKIRAFSKFKQRNQSLNSPP